MRKFIYLSLSLFLVFSSVTSANAASPAGWAVNKAVSSGARVIVNATNGGYKSAVNIAPNLGRITLRIARAANLASVAYSLGQLALDGTDFVLDPDNNTIKFKQPIPAGSVAWNIGQNMPYIYLSPEEAGLAYCDSIGRVFVEIWATGKTASYVRCNGGKTGHIFGLKDVLEKIIPISALSNQIVSDATKGNKSAKDFLVSVAVAGVNAGDFDADLISGAVPVSDNKPLIPAIPGSQVGDVDSGMGGGDVGAAADAAKNAADAAKNAADAAKNAAIDARAAADAAKDLINTAIDQAIKDAASKAAADAAKNAADAKAVSDAAVVAAQAAAAEAVKEAAKAKEAAKEAAKDLEKPFELPPFCSWASTVCDFIDWVKRDPVIDDSDGTLEIDEPSDSMHEGILERLYISMPAQCPPDPVLEFMGSRIPFPMSVFCQFASMMKPLILLFAYIKGLSVIGSGLS